MFRIFKKNQNVFVYYVLSAICPELHRLCVEFDLELAHNDLRRSFFRLMARAIKLAEAFQLVDNGLSKPFDVWITFSAKSRGTKSRNNIGKSVSVSRSLHNPAKRFHFCEYGSLMAWNNRLSLHACMACPRTKRIFYLNPARTILLKTVLQCPQRVRRLYLVKAPQFWV